ncbi:MAG: molybdopterin molybdotransferase MoeA [Polyangiaceae bacterium]|nr:molybdopterin molybdotransferase MoeA [Polyangiaceae bacterium]
MLPFDEAQRRLVSSVAPVDAERVGIFEADGRVLAEDIVAPWSLPSFDHSSMDGYAVRTAELGGAPPHRLPVRGTSAAGGPIAAAPSDGAVRIYTGAPLPIGMDAVIMQEDVTATDVGGVPFISFDTQPAPSAWIRRRGDDLAEGSIALAKGRRLSPGSVALAAALNRASLLVARRPVVTILGTGDELRTPGDPPRESSVVESNGFFVASAARRVGAIARLGPFVRDDPDAARDAVKAALAGTDLLVTIGGVSVGDRDFVRPALEAAGVSIEFYKVAMKPGKPLTVGRHGRTLVLGLPGNPASASLTFLLFGVPVLRAMMAELDPLPSPRKLRVEGRLSRKPGRTEFARARLLRDDAGDYATLLPNQASGAVTSFAEADALAVIDASRGDFQGPDTLEVIAVSDILKT